MGLTITRSTFEPHPKGVFVGTLADVAYDEEGNFGPQIKWVFDTQAKMADGSPFRQTYWTTPKLNEMSNLFKLLEAFGEDPEDERWTEIEDVSDFDFLIGREVQLNIIHKKKPDGTVNSRIDGALPLPVQGGASAPTRESRERREERQPAAAGRGRDGKIWREDD